MLKSHWSERVLGAVSGAATVVCIIYTLYAIGDKAWTGYVYQRDAHRTALSVAQWLLAPAATSDGKVIAGDKGQPFTRAQVLEAVAQEKIDAFAAQVLAQQQAAKQATPKAK